MSTAQHVRSEGTRPLDIFLRSKYLPSHVSRFSAHVFKDRLAAQPERYARFLKAFSDIYGAGAPDRSYEERVELMRKKMRDDVLKGHDDLLEGFESFIKSEG
jgi:hypothetical protein